MKLKTNESRREITMEPSLARLLREHKLASRFSGDDDYVFSARNGKPLHYRNVSRRGLDPAVTAAKLNEGDVAKVSFHNLRHTYACIRIAEGWDVTRLAEEMGHASPSITMDVYGNKRFRRARENGIREGLLESILRRALDGRSMESAPTGRAQSGADDSASLRALSG